MSRRLTLMAFMLVLLNASPLWAQMDLFTIDGGQIPAGGAETFDIYLRDVSGTSIDTGTTNIGAIGMSFTTPPGLVADASFQRAGVIANANIIVEQDNSDPSSNLLKWTILFASPPPFNLDAPAPGDLIGRLTLTAAAGASGQQITLQPNIGPDFFLQDELGVIDELYGQGELTGNFGAINIVAGVPEIQSFAVTPSIIEAGESATLSWNVSDADAVSIDQGIGNVSGSGSRTVSPTETTTYQITASNGFGVVSETVALTVNPAMPVVINTFQVTPESVVAGESALLSWDVANATSISIDQGVGAVPASGDLAVTPLVTTTYRLTATNAGGDASATVTLTVLPLEAVIQSFTATPSAVPAGGDVSLAWVVSNADTISIDQGLGPVSATGSLIVNPDQTTTYQLTAENAAGSVSATVTVTVIPLQIDFFTASPRVIVLGESTTLSWQARGALEVLLSQTVGEETTELGSAPPVGDQTFSPQLDTTYVLTARTQDDVRTSSVTVEVLADDLLRSSAEEVIFDMIENASIDLFNAVDRPLDWDVIAKPAWLSVDPQSGTTSANPVSVDLLLDRSLLHPGLNRGVLTFRANGRDLEIPVRAGDTVLIFPLVRSDNAFSTRVGVVNLEARTLAYRLEVFNQDGSLAADAVTGDIAELETVNHSVETLANGLGWARFTTPGKLDARIQGFSNTRSLDGQELYAYPGSIPADQSVIVPHVAANTLFNTRGAVVNTSAAADMFSFVADSEAFEINVLNPGQQDLFDFRQVMDGEVRGRGWGDLTALEAQTTLAAVEVFERANKDIERQSVAVGLDRETGLELIFPHIAADTNIFWTGVALVNPGDAPVQINYEIYDEFGMVVSAPDLATTIQPGAKQLYLVDQFVQQLGPGAAWLKVRADQQILGYMLFGSHVVGDFFSGFQSLKRGFRRLCFPHLEETVTTGGFTGIAVVNPGDENTEVTIMLIDQSGNLKAQSQRPLGPKQKIVALAADLFSETFSFGDKIVVSGSSPLAGFEIFGLGRQTLGGILAIGYD